ncbi:KRAB-A domain-containing protein 2, partial [Podochytrium sp. JEL0797]
VDLMQISMTSQEGYNYVLVFVDVATKFVLLWPIQSKTGAEEQGPLLQIFMDFGFPKAIQSDGGTEFINRMVKALVDRSGVWWKTMPYNPKPMDTWMGPLDMCASKLQPRYEGPYLIVLDAEGNLLGREYSPQQLKLISGDIDFEPMAEVKDILQH